jgi:release factor glutamine methyltransferase
MAMKTVLDCLESGSRYLEERGIEDARRNMQWLLANQLGCSRIDLYTQFDRPLAETDLGPLRKVLKRRGAGEPLQHLLGTVEFCGHEFRCDRRALVPRPETEELVVEILKLPIPRPCRILDVGTGSGVLGLSLAKALGADCEEAVLADLSAEALELARENAELLGLEPTIVECDLLTKVEGRFHLVGANLPYVADSDRDEIAAEVRHDPPSALFAGSDGLAVIRKFVPAVRERIEPGGFLAMEIGREQGSQVAALLVEAGFDKVEVRDDLSGKPRFVFAPAPGTP